MSRKQRYRQRLCILLAVSLVFIAGYYYNMLRNSIPDYIRIEEGNSYPFIISKGIDVTLKKQAVQTASTEVSSIPENEIKMDVSEDTLFSQEQIGSYIVEYKLLGIIGIKSAEVDVVEKQSLIPCGFPVGIYVETEGVLVIGTGSVTGTDGEKSSPAENIMKSGDYIYSINGESITTKQQLMDKINEYGRDDVILGVRRNDEEMQVKLKPVKTGENEYRLGIWIRDNTQGVGMLTFATQDGTFGALGHGINDIDTNLLMHIQQGKILKTDILSIIKGEKGNPGELVGVIDYKDNNVIGKITKNTACGIFGTLNEKLMQAMDTKSMEVAMKQDIQKGAATIMTCIDGNVQEYDIQIMEVNVSEKNQNKGLVIQVTDEELLSMTGGIVQGMSGSPIIQNGKIIGAVTHVFVQDPTKGFGIFIENMLAECQ